LVTIDTDNLFQLCSHNNSVIFSNSVSEHSKLGLPCSTICSESTQPLCHLHFISSFSCRTLPSFYFQILQCELVFYSPYLADLFTQFVFSSSLISPKLDHRFHNFLLLKPHLHPHFSIQQHGLFVFLDQYHFKT